LLDRITVHGARQHNLKNIDVEIPRNAFTVITDSAAPASRRWRSTPIYAEASGVMWRRSPPMRASSDQMERPDVDSIDG